MEVDKILEQKRHTELRDTMKMVLEELRKQNGDSSIKESLDRQTKSIENFASAITNLPKPANPNVSVETNQDKVVDSIKEMAQAIIDNLSELKKAVDAKPTEWSFKIERDHMGFSKNIIAKAK